MRWWWLIEQREISGFHSRWSDGIYDIFNQELRTKKIKRAHAFLQLRASAYHFEILIEIGRINFLQFSPFQPVYKLLSSAHRPFSGITGKAVCVYISGIPAQNSISFSDIFLLWKSFGMHSVYHIKYRIISKVFKRDRQNRFCLINCSEQQYEK